MRLLLLMIIFLVPIVCSASDEIKCNQAGTQAELNVCAKDEYDQADRELNHTYQLLVKEATADKLFVSRLKLAQRAWIAYRDAELDAYFACAEPDVRICFGSMYPLLYFSRKTALTHERSNHLKQILKHGRGD
jgi:uncharacterized protein YecT (DUF1311 family)